MSTYTSQAMARELADLLKKWLAATMPVCVETNDANGDPTIKFSADSGPTTGEKVVLIRIKQVPNSLAKDVLGNTAIQFGPHRIQLCTEANDETTGTDDILTAAELAPLLVEIGRKGCELEWYVTTAGTVPTVDALNTLETAGTVTGRWFPLYWNVLASS